MKKLIIIALSLITLGGVSQIVEKNIDKEQVKTVVTMNLKEQDDKNDTIDYGHDDNEEYTLTEKIGF
ncbi:hypothetical protein P7D85_11790 [Enterococcus hulanensis]|uniref:Secreted protein n=1 Tax=Enterococcus hulanensis TaxID=2559929 RepID=A0ABU3EZZ5_9ENTE|nr:hypothetical protein [Enterococcus hulanensis]MDT2600459.1 hypothetical protein [Enterococcus hulanensis]MDT2609803.1 hypothetical protein [Enterococcus hulanensis]MDT2617569.1 hypothetical protein [Enterococcus hulanensis]MDT2628794.1 hypothetical protein [Enterococcus hulanensis]MDT2656134.1 hypothetical protein [Enterococcus hulanensis]